MVLLLEPLDISKTPFHLTVLVGTWGLLEQLGSKKKKLPRTVQASRIILGESCGELVQVKISFSSYVDSLFIYFSSLLSTFHPFSGLLRSQNITQVSSSTRKVDQSMLKCRRRACQVHLKENQTARKVKKVKLN